MWTGRGSGFAKKRVGLRLRSKLSGLPRIEDRNPSLREVVDVARDNRKIVVNCGRRQQAVNYRQRSSIEFGFGCEQTPAIREGSVDGKNSAVETRLQFYFQPSLETRSAFALRQGCDAFSYFSKGENTQKK